MHSRHVYHVTRRTRVVLLTRPGFVRENIFRIREPSAFVWNYGSFRILHRQPSRNTFTNRSSTLGAKVCPFLYMWPLKKSLSTDYVYVGARRFFEIKMYPLNTDGSVFKNEKYNCQAFNDFTLFVTAFGRDRFIFFVLCAGLRLRLPASFPQLSASPVTCTRPGIFD